MEYSGAKQPQPAMIVSDYDEQGNPIYSVDPSGKPVKTNGEKIFGLVIVLIGLACTMFIGIKMKRKVEEINNQAR
jgi:hypothetical protein